MKEPIKHKVTSNDLTIYAYEWPGKGNPLLFAHATGFHARVWDQILMQFPGRHLITIDMMAHGSSDKPTAITSWEGYVHNILDVIDTLHLQDIVAIGHSMGGHSVTAAAAHRPDKFKGLILLDPVILFFMDGESAFLEIEPENFPTARRRNTFKNAEEFYEYLMQKPTFQEWDKQILHDYCKFGLMTSTNGEDELQLACPPLLEASTYVTSHKSPLLNVLSEVNIPVEIIRARVKTEGDLRLFENSPTDPDLVHRFPHANDTYLPEVNHFFPMTHPSLTVSLIREKLANIESS